MIVLVLVVQFGGLELVRGALHLGDTPCNSHRPITFGSLSPGVTLVIPVVSRVGQGMVPDLLTALAAHVRYAPMEVVFCSSSPDLLPVLLDTSAFNHTPISVRYLSERRGANDLWERVATCGATAARYEFLLFLSPYVTPWNDVVTPLASALLANASAGIAGCHLLGINVKAGLDAQPITVLNHGYDVALKHFQMPVLFHRLRGYSSKDARLREVQTVTAVSSFCLMVRASLFERLEGFDAKVRYDVALSPRGDAIELEHQLPVFDLCFRSLRLGFHTVVTSGAVALDADDDHGAPGMVLAANEELTWVPPPSTFGLHTTMPPTARLAIWTSFLWRLFHSTSTDSPLGPWMQILWQLPEGPKCTGFGNEAVHFTVPLEADGHYAIRLWHARADQFCPGWPPFMQQAIERLTSGRGFGTLMGQRSQQPIQVLVLHGIPIVERPKLSTIVRPDYIVARSMYEYTLFPSRCLFRCFGEQFVDEVWVPSRHAYDVFLNSGVPEEMLFILPEPVDVYFYDPEVTVPFLLPRDLYTAGWNTTGGEYHGEVAVSTINTRKDHFKFLSIFKLEARKGWDVLVDAYVQEFTASDPVSLYVFPRNPGHEQSAFQVWRLFEARAKALGVRSMPHIQVVSQTVAETTIPRLYRSVDAFVLPTKAEGWGLPIIQAMAMGLPTIATAWSGQVDFMTPETSYLLNYTLEEVPPEGDPRVPHSKWAAPSVSHLRHLMRKVYSDPEGAKATGRAARRHVMEHFSEAAIMRRVKQRLDAIRGIAMERRNRTHTIGRAAPSRSSTSSTLPRIGYRPRI